MAVLISFQSWKNDTYSRWSRRSKELQALDRAIELFHVHEGWREESDFLKRDFKEQLRQADLKKVDEAFGAWRTAKGLDYLESTRNKKGAVAELEQQLRSARILTRSEQQAFAAMDEMRSQSIATIFGGKHLEWRSLVKKNRLDTLTATSQTISVVSRTAQVARIAKAGGNVAKNPMLANALSKLGGDIVKTAFGVSGLEQIGGIIGQIVAEWIKDFIAAVTPWVGIAASGAMLVYNTAMAASQGYLEYQLVKARTYVRSGDPSAAAKALRELIERDRNMYLRAAARSGAELSAKLASAFVDGGAAIGPATGAASAIAGLLDTICMVGREWQEKNKVNKLLKNAELQGPDLFATCPLLGAMFLATASDYEIMMVLTDDFGRANWMDHVEQIKKAHIGPLQLTASSYVFNSRFVLCDADGSMLSYKGTIPQRGTDKLKKKLGLKK